MQKVAHYKCRETLVYHKALEVEFRKCGVPFQSEVEIPVYYDGVKLDCSYRADFICYDSFIVELKAIKQLSDMEKSQVINYMNATQISSSLLINFGATSLDFKRLDNSINNLRQSLQSSVQPNIQL